MVASGAYDLRDLKFLLSGGEPIDATTVREFLRAAESCGLDPASFCAAYGMAEATLGVAFSPQGTGLVTDSVDELALQSGIGMPATSANGMRELVVVGPALDGLAIRLEREDGSEPCMREIGEVYIEGSSVTKGCLEPSPTTEPDSGAGWLATGDLGYMTVDGLVITGRKKELIIVAERNIYPQEVERAAESVPGVRRGNVLAFQLDSVGPASPGVVILLESRDTDYAWVCAEVSRAVLMACGIRPIDVRVEAVGSLLKTPSGKLRRVEAKSRYTPDERD